jgi:hypothetical protein
MNAHKHDPPAFPRYVHREVSGVPCSRALEYDIRPESVARLSQLLLPAGLARAEAGSDPERRRELASVLPRLNQVDRTCAGGASYLEYQQANSAAPDNRDAVTEA